MPEPAQVFCQRGDRLGARLNNLLCALQFAETVGAEVKVNWPPSGLVLSPQGLRADEQPHAFFDLFDEASFRQVHRHVEVTHHDLAHFEARIAQVPFLRIGELTSRPVGFFRDHPTRRFYYDVTHAFGFTDLDRPAAGLRPVFLKLRLSAAVRSALGKVLAELPVKQAVALHVRRGDVMDLLRAHDAGGDEGDDFRFAQSRHISSKYAPYEAYREYVRKVGAGGPVVVLSEDGGLKQRFREEFGSRFLDYDCLLDGCELTSIQRDFVEFLLIFHARDSVGPFSAFGQLSAHLAGRQSRFIHAFIPTSALIRDLDAMLGRAQADAALYVRVLQEFAHFFRKLGDHAKAGEIVRHLQTHSRGDQAPS